MCGAVVESHPIVKVYGRNQECTKKSGIAGCRVSLWLLDLQVHDVLHERAVFALDEGLQRFDACLE